MANTIISYEIHNNVARIFIEGSINEFFRREAKVLDAIKCTQAIFNFKKLSFINSVGIQKWIDFLKSFQTDKTVYFEECSPIIVNQLNMLPEFKGTAQVSTILAEFLCEECSHVEVKKLKCSQDYDSLAMQLKQMPCPKCQQGDCFLPDFPESFLAFCRKA